MDQPLAWPPRGLRRTSSVDPEIIIIPGVYPSFLPSFLRSFVRSYPSYSILFALRRQSKDARHVPRSRFDVSNKRFERREKEHELRGVLEVLVVTFVRLDLDGTRQRDFFFFFLRKVKERVEQFGLTTVFKNK